jgi:SAM-dependent methyltransferase
MRTIACTQHGFAGHLAQYRGLLQIVRFNWPFYTGALLAIVFCLVNVFLARGWLLVFLVPALVATLFWTVSSLVASHLVYDLSPLTQWTWITDLIPVQPRRAANLHAGFDETSHGLRRIFPQTEWRIWDFYDPLWMTEASIKRARRLSSGPPAEAVSIVALPAGDQSLDAAFLLFSAHELRSKALRNEFFRELRRVLRIGGTLLIVEHLRDAANFAVYGPGFLHFLSRSEWLRLARVSGFDINYESRMTAFVRVFLLRRRI